MASIGALSVNLPVHHGAQLSGFGGAGRRWNGKVGLPIEANVLTIKSDTGGFVVVCSIDVVYANELVRRVRKHYLGTDVTVIFAASHTHFAPSLMPEFGPLGEFSPEFATQCEKVVVDAIDVCIARASNGATATLSATCKDTNPVSRRRRLQLAPSRRFPFLRKRYLMAPENGHLQDALIEARVLHAGDTNVVLWTFPCHPTSYHGNNDISGEYPSAARKAIRDQLGEDTVVLFFLGPCGDIRQPFVSRFPWRIGVSGVIKMLLGGGKPSYFRPNQSQWSQWTNALSRKVAEIAKDCKSAKVEPLQCSFVRNRLSSSAIFHGNHPVPEVEFELLKLGKEAGVAFSSAEITSDLGVELFGEPGSDQRSVWPCTCANQCVGYLASADEIKQGGYEGGDWCQQFACNSQLRADSPETIESMIQPLTIGFKN